MPPLPEAKTRTPEQNIAWQTYEACVRPAPDVATLIGLTDELGKVDKGQASFAYNRAKKAMEEMGFFREHKWLKKGYGPMGLKLREEFFAVLRGVSADMLPKLKSAFLNEDSHRLKSRKRVRPSLPVEIRDPEISIFESAGGSSLTQFGGMPVQKVKKPKKNGSEKPSESAVTGENVDGSAPSVVLTAAAAVAPDVQLEAAKSIKSARLADAMQHASFALLSKPQQQAVRDEWLALLK